MAIREVIQIGDPRLKAENKIVSDFNDEKVKQVITDLVETMRSKELIGMATPQIGENYKIFVTEPRETKFRIGDQTDTLRIYINPLIINFSEIKSTIYEGCGSVVNGQLFGPVARASEILIEAFDENGKKFQLTCDGILARVIQHEYDHLIGIEFTEIISDYKKIIDLNHYLENIRNSEEQVSASIIHKKDFKFI